jgi:putative hydrolase of the HAD superfamily
LIKGIIFDLGSTLMRFTGDWSAVFQTGAEAMVDWYVRKKHIQLDTSALIKAFLAVREAGWNTAQHTHTEVTAQASLRRALQKINAPAVAETLVEAAIKVYFGPEEALYQPYPDAAATLKILKAQGYRLGLYSNATDDALIQRLVNQGGLRPWLSPTFSSAGWGWRKPNREPFNLIAARWGLPPHEIVVVGDTLNADVLGAQNAGMSSILVTMDENRTNADNRHIQPTATAVSLSALPEIIARLA